MRSLREWRAEQLLSVEELAARAGVSNKTIIQLEHGRQLATFRTIRRISGVLRVEPAEISEFAGAIAERSQPPTQQGSGQ
jgi:transcriptional regulator with XRE-family HTH domain